MDGFKKALEKVGEIERNLTAKRFGRVVRHHWEIGRPLIAQVFESFFDLPVFRRRDPTGVLSES